MMCGALCIEEMCHVVGSGSCVEKGQGGDGGGDETKSEPVLSFMEELCVFESMRAFMYGYNFAQKERTTKTH
jgi:hypothetical protein